MSVENHTHPHNHHPNGSTEFFHYRKKVPHFLAILDSCDLKAGRDGCVEL
jgi:hypothetical protein